MAHYSFTTIPHGMMKNGVKLNTGLHFDYICREKKYEHIRGRDEDLVYKQSGNIPAWADSAADFWQKVEQYRNPNGRGYREYIIALQSEFTLEENIELVEQFIAQTGISKNHAYTYAIHDKEATFDSTLRNPHVHLMFNEKIIEKDRPLGPDKYFKNYARNRKGEPTQGYRTSQYFDQDSATLELREMWADLCNRKFRQKGLDLHVDHRTLKKQKADLENQGKFNEAKLLDREPAPHLGNIYKNPKTLKKIKQLQTETEKELDQEIEENLPGKEYDIECMSQEEIKMVNFVQDLVLRKLAKEIQRERDLLRKQDEEEWQKIFGEKEENPYAISVTDIREKLQQKAETENNKALEYKGQYRKVYQEINPVFIKLRLEMAKLQKKIKITKENKPVNLDLLIELEGNLKNNKEKQEQILDNLAQDIVFHGLYSKAKTDYRNAKVAEKRNQEMYAKAIKERPANLDEIRDNYIRNRNVINKEKERSGKLIASYKKLAETTHKGILEHTKKAIQQSIEEKIGSANKIYSKYIYAQKNQKHYQDLIEKTKDLPEESIIFAEKIPATVTYRSRVDGVMQLKEFPKRVIEGEIYYIIRDEAGKQFAVKDGDTIERGKAQLYQVKGRSVEKVPEMKDGSDKIKFYATKEKNAKMHAQQPPQLRGDISRKIDQITDQFIKGEIPKLQAYWNINSDEPVNELKLAENKLYSGWKL
ncbi:MAG: MobA/MobL family protein [Acidaminococcaceae bacterium]|nr:MobA/MobL family protein [Acidaminococcaceae bacterium]